MENSFASLLNSARSILVLLPTKPYLDQVAGALALYLGLKDTKETSISCPNPMLVEYNRLVGVNKIVTETGNKNLLIRFNNYPADNIERVSADVENREFCLSVIPKAGLAAPKKDQVELTFSGVSADLIILIGGSNESHFPASASADLAGAKLVHIGTKPLTLAQETGILSFARPASSVSEIVAEIIKESGLILDSDIATNLIAGIEEGSNHFTGENVGAETFALLAELLRAGGQRMQGSRFPKRTFPAGSIKPEEPAPKDWFEPKIYKGTSVS